MKRALITGITGQDGSYLAELLLGKGYEVHGLIRRSSTFNTGRLAHLYQDPHTPECRLFLHYGDLLDVASLDRILVLASPDEVYNLAGQSHVRVSFDMPVHTGDVNGLGAVRLFESIRSLGLNPRIYHASSSEMFGRSPAPQSETTALEPVSPYGIAKAYAHTMAKYYRDAYGLAISCGILFNHESPRRSETFVTRKITRAAARICRGSKEKLYLGNLDARRDWGYAPEYVDAMWRMLQHSTAEDFVIATGESHSVREFLAIAFQLVGLDYAKYLESDRRYFRPLEVDHLCGDAGKARDRLGWRPKTSFNELVRIMVNGDLYDELTHGTT